MSRLFVLRGGMALGRPIDLRGNRSRKPLFSVLRELNGSRSGDLCSLRPWLSQRYPEWGDVSRLRDNELMARIEDALRMGHLGVCDATPENAFAAQGSPTPAPAVEAVPQTITVAEAQEMALKITCYFEGSKPMNYQALADDGDGQGTSFGIIQWNFGTNTLGPLLKKMLARDATAFAACFGKDADYDTLKKALDANDKAAQLKWARDLLKANRAEWSKAFTNLGINTSFQLIQRDQASADYHPAVVKAIKVLRGECSSMMETVEFRSYAALFDLCIQQGSITKAVDEIKARIDEEDPQTQFELMKIVVSERACTAKTTSMADSMSRRMGILTGATFDAEEGGVKKSRSNPNFNLITESGKKIVAGL